MTAIWWIRRDLRLGDNPALVEAAKAGRVLPVFIRDKTFDDLGAAPKWRFGLGLEKLDETLRDMGGHILFRSGAADTVLKDLAKEVDATGIYFNRLYDKGSRKAEKAVCDTFDGNDCTICSTNGHVLFEPWTVETKQGGYYKVYSPYWRAVKDRSVGRALSRPDIEFAKTNAESEDLSDWDLGAAMDRGADVVLDHTNVGEASASSRLSAFITHHVDHYKQERDYPTSGATSGLSENLTYGEISVRSVWHAGWRAFEEGGKGAEHFVKELVWREFAYHLLYHEPDMPRQNHRDGWTDFPWRQDNSDAEAWRRGMTGVQFVDAAMREMYVTGTMHNRARMVVASYLTKHLLTDWRVGCRWFEDCLIDWDPASNALGWQWTAGCGPDAAPYFRIYNPETQADKFDGDGRYRRAWIAEGASRPTKTALSYFDAVPRSWDLSPDDLYPEPVISLSKGRDRSLEAYESIKA